MTKQRKLVALALGLFVIGVGLAGAALLIGRAQSDSSPASPSESTAPFRLTEDRCRVEPNATGTYNGTVTNDGDGPQLFTVEVTFLKTNRDRIGGASAVVGPVPPHATAP